MHFTPFNRKHLQIATAPCRNFRNKFIFTKSRDGNCPWRRGGNNGAAARKSNLNTVGRRLCVNSKGPCVSRESSKRKLLCNNNSKLEGVRGVASTTAITILSSCLIPRQPWVAVGSYHNRHTFLTALDTLLAWWLTAVSSQTPLKTRMSVFSKKARNPFISCKSYTLFLRCHTRGCRSATPPRAARQPLMWSNEAAAESSRNFLAAMKMVFFLVWNYWATGTAN